MVNRGHHIVQRGIKVIGHCSTFKLRVGTDPRDLLLVFQEIPAVVTVASFPSTPLKIDGAQLGIRNTRVDAVDGIEPIPVFARCAPSFKTPELIPAVRHGCRRKTDIANFQVKWSPLVRDRIVQSFTIGGLRCKRLSSDVGSKPPRNEQQKNPAPKQGFRKCGKLSAH